MTKVMTLKFFGLLVLIGLNTLKLNACSCDTISFKDAIEYADEIFVGKIVKAERFENGKFINAYNKEEINWDWRYYFEIEKKWKGNNESRIVVHHQGTSCDLFFGIYERRYLVYAARNSGNENPLGVNNGKDRLTTWLCSRTIANRTWEKEIWYEEDIEKLNKKFPNGINLKEIRSNMFLWAFGGMLISIIMLMLIRKNKNRG